MTRTPHTEHPEPGLDRNRAGNRFLKGVRRRRDEGRRAETPRYSARRAAATRYHHRQHDPGGGHRRTDRQRPRRRRHHHAQTHTANGKRAQQRMAGATGHQGEDQQRGAQPVHGRPAIRRSPPEGRDRCHGRCRQEHGDAAFSARTTPPTAVSTRAAPSVATNTAPTARGWRSGRGTQPRPRRTPTLRRAHPAQVASASGRRWPVPRPATTTRSPRGPNQLPR